VDTCKDQGTLQKLLGSAGKVIDVALLFTPIPLKKLRFLKNYKVGNKLYKAAKKINRFTRKGKKALMGIPLLGQVLNNLSVETWGNRIGTTIDRALNPNTSVQIEDQEAKNLYLEAVKPYHEKGHSLSFSIQSKEKEMELKKEELIAAKNKIEVTDQKIYQLKDVIEKESRALKDQQDQVSFFHLADSLMSNAYRELLDRKSDGLYSKTREEIIQFFSQVRQTKVQEFTAGIDQAIQNISGDIKEAENAYNLDRGKLEETFSALKSKMEDLVKMKVELENVLQ
jgi:hypothetical protein